LTQGAILPAASAPGISQFAFEKMDCFCFIRAVLAIDFVHKFT
jgi:cytochrome c oxidase assembly protein Cox11